MDAQLTIARTSGDDIQQRQVIIKLDGKLFATLLFGQTATLEIPPGPHRLRFDNTWQTKNVDFEAAPGEHVKFRTINTAGRFTWFLVGIFGAGPMYLSVEREA